MNPNVRVQLVDDHPIVREGLRTVLTEEDGIEVVGEAGDGAEALRLVDHLRPDVLLLDLVMPGMGGLEVLERLPKGGGAPRVVVLTSFAEDLQVGAALASGAVGYLLKDVTRPELVSALRGAKVGRPTLHPDAQRILLKRMAAPPKASPLDALTPRERSVLELIGQGQSNKKIGKALHLSEGTVKGYVSAILAKLGAEDRTQAALIAVRHGLCH